ncbi:hypothetical protein A9G19_04580 [Gilliamella apis]|nr:hypothetical protein A9G19_04580 [Gilliamella apis]
MGLLYQSFLKMHEIKFIIKNKAIFLLIIILIPLIYFKLISILAFFLFYNLNYSIMINTSQIKIREQDEQVRK